MKKVICECGSSKWIPTGNSTTETIFNGRTWIEYRCASCGKYYNQEQPRTGYSEPIGVEIWDNEPEILEVGKVINEMGLANNFLNDATCPTTIDDVSTIAEPSKVRYE